MGTFRVRPRAKPRGHIPPRSSSSSTTMGDDSISISSGSSGLSAFRDAFDELVRDSMLDQSNHASADEEEDGEEEEIVQVELGAIDGEEHGEESEEDLDWIEQGLRQMEEEAEVSLENRSPPPPPRKVWPPPTLETIESEDREHVDDYSEDKQEALGEVKESCETQESVAVPLPDTSPRASEKATSVASDSTPPLLCESDVIPDDAAQRPEEAPVAAVEIDVPAKKNEPFAARENDLPAKEEEEQQASRWNFFSRRPCNTKSNKDLAEQISQDLLEAGKQATIGQNYCFSSDERSNDLQSEQLEEQNEDKELDGESTSSAETEEEEMPSNEDRAETADTITPHASQQAKDLPLEEDEITPNEETEEKTNYMNSPDREAGLQALLQLAQAGESGFLTNDEDSLNASIRTASERASVPFLSEQVASALSKLKIVHGNMDHPSPRSVDFKLEKVDRSDPGSVRRLVHLFESGQISHAEFHSLSRKSTVIQSKECNDSTPNEPTEADKVDRKDESVTLEGESPVSSLDRTPPVRAAIRQFELRENSAADSAVVTTSPKPKKQSMAPSPHSPVREAVHKFNLIHETPGLKNFMMPQPPDLLEQKPWRKLSQVPPTIVPAPAFAPPSIGMPTEAPSRSVDRGDSEPTPARVKKGPRASVVKKESAVKAAAIRELKMQKRRQEGEFLKRCRSERIVSSRQPEADPALQRFLKLAMQDSQEKRDKLKAIREGMVINAGVGVNAMSPLRTSLAPPPTSNQLSISDHPRSHGRVNLHEMFEWNQMMVLRNRDADKSSSSESEEKKRRTKSEHHRKKKNGEGEGKSSRREREGSGSKKKKKKHRRRVADGSVADKSLSRAAEERKTPRSLTVAAMRAQSSHEKASKPPLDNNAMRTKSSHVKQSKSSMPVSDDAMSSKANHSKAKIKGLVDEIKKADAGNGMRSTKHSRANIIDVVGEIQRANAEGAVRPKSSPGKKLRASVPSPEDAMTSKSKHSRARIKEIVDELQRGERKKPPRSRPVGGMGSKSTHMKRFAKSFSIDDDNSLRSQSTHERSKPVGLGQFLEQNEAKATHVSMQDFIERSVASGYAGRPKRSTKSVAGSATSQSMNTFTERYQALQRAQLKKIDPTLERSIFASKWPEEDHFKHGKKEKSFRPALHL